LAKLARVVLPGVPHHVTQRGVRSMNIFSCDGIRNYYLELLQSASIEFGFSVLSYCLMSNHVHLLVVPVKVTSLSQGIGIVHSRGKSRGKRDVLALLPFNVILNQILLRQGPFPHSSFPVLG
jgi:REP element-mobilizing transposase RayT